MKKERRPDGKKHEKGCALVSYHRGDCSPVPWENDWSAAYRAGMREAVERALALAPGHVDDFRVWMTNGYERCWIVEWNNHLEERRLVGPPVMTEWSREASAARGEPVASTEWKLQRRTVSPSSWQEVPLP